MLPEIVLPAGTLEPRDMGRLPRWYDMSTKIASAPLPFGCWAVRGTGPEHAGLPANADDVAARSRGLVIRASDPVLVGPAVLGYDINSPATLLRRGRAWVIVEAPVSQDGKLYVRFAAGREPAWLAARRFRRRHRCPDRPL